MNWCGMPPGGLPFLFRQEREERSRVKGVAERSESCYLMLAGGKHTATNARAKAPPWQSPAASKMVRLGIRTPKPVTLCRTTCVRRITHSTAVSKLLGLRFFPTIKNLVVIDKRCCTAVRASGVRGGFDCGSKQLSPRKPTSLVTFLFGDKKVTRPLTAL